MNDEMQKQAAEVLRKAIEAAQKGGEWAAGQVPDVIHQLMAWTILKGALGLVGIVVVVVLWCLFAPRHARWVANDRDFGDRALTYLPVAFAAIASGAACVFMVDSVLDGGKAVVAPKLFLLEYAASLVR